MIPLAQRLCANDMVTQRLVESLAQLDRDSCLLAWSYLQGMANACSIPLALGMALGFQSDRAVYIVLAPPSTPDLPLNAHARSPAILVFTNRLKPPPHTPKSP